MSFLLLREITRAQLGRNPYVPVSMLVSLPNSWQSLLSELVSTHRQQEWFWGPILRQSHPALHVEAQLEGAGFPAGSHPMKWRLLLMKYHPVHLRKPKVLGCWPTAVPEWPASGKWHGSALPALLEALHAPIHLRGHYLRQG